jgi:ubiquitin-activating enzyme E1-like protein 2
LFFNLKRHLSFLQNAAKLYATIYYITVTEKDLAANALMNILSEVKIQEFKPSNKVVQTDETARKPDHVPISSEDERNAVFQLEKAISSNEASKSKGNSLKTF